MAPSRFIACVRNDLQLRPMLLGGQSFRWTMKEEDHYIGVTRNSVWDIVQNDKGLQYKCYPENSEDSEKVLRNYLRMDTDLKPLYKIWSKDSQFKKASKKFYGVRMLDQDVIENIFSFICSSNNNIARISSMIDKLCKLYGKHITTLDGVDYYGFPNASSLADPKVEAALRTAGFGYRAKFIYETACRINEEGEEKWVETLKSMDYPSAKNELKSLAGIGPKVADCICLMSLGHLQAIPVDTHVFQIAAKYYLKHLAGKKSVTDKIYNEIGDHFRELFGENAGWAHTILFCDDLKVFKESKKRKADAN